MSSPLVVRHTLQILALALLWPPFTASLATAQACSRQDIAQHIQDLAGADQARAITGLTTCGDIAVPALLDTLQQTVDLRSYALTKVHQ
jgi:hypothetical protein